MTAGTGLMLLVLAVCLVGAALDRGNQRLEASDDDLMRLADAVQDDQEYAHFLMWEAGR